MSLEIIQTLNPEYTIKSITDEAFRTYGKVIDNNIDEAIEFLFRQLNKITFIFLAF